MAPSPPPYLTPELIEEILLRVSPEHPACLVRASVACKSWRRFLSNPAFRRRYLAFHRMPPLLGFLHNRWRGLRLTRGDASAAAAASDDGVVPVPAFVATATPSPFPPQAFDGCPSWCVVDCRHGRVLFEASDSTRNGLGLVVWDPATGERKRLPTPPAPRCGYAAAVLCALHGRHGGCDHLDCCSGGGPFFVVLVEPGVGGSSVRVHLYSSEAASWNSSPSLCSGFNVNSNRSTLVGNDIYFLSASGSRDKILRYSLGSNRVSFLQAPAAADRIYGGFFLVPMEDDVLGLGTIVGARLCLWSRNVVVDPDDVVAGAGWVQCMATQIWRLIPCPTFDIEVVGCADDLGIIFVATDAGVFTIDVKSSRARKVAGAMKCFKIFPFRAFYTPGSRYCCAS